MRLAILYYLAQIQTQIGMPGSASTGLGREPGPPHANITAQVSRLHAPS